MFLTQTYNNLPVWGWLLILSTAITLIIVGVVFVRFLCKRLTLQNIDGIAGFAYDSRQQIFYSEQDAWQRRFGYCRMYDEAAPFFNMIIDSEPVRFRYGGKSWLIELWKGQYGMTTGAEIGIYYTRRRVGNSKKSHDKAFYKCVKDKDMLPVSIQLLKNGKELFNYRKRHWWLTGFVPGEFSRPEELEAVYSITFPNYKMRDAFVQALLDMGYDYNRFIIIGFAVRILFTSPLSVQPATRAKREHEAQAVNKKLCELWEKATYGIDDTQDKLDYVSNANPDLYKSAVTFGKTPRLFLPRKTKKSKKKACHDCEC